MQEEVLQGQEFEANAVDPPRGRTRERIILHPPAQHEDFPAEAGPTGTPSPVHQSTPSPA